MREFYSLIFEQITGNLNISESFIDNYIIIAIIGFVAFIVAYRLVGKMFNIGLITGRNSGSFFHWIIRLFVFIILFSVIKFAINYTYMFIIIALILVVEIIIYKIISRL